MRSRDGDSPYLFTILALIVTTTLGASSYFISYKRIVHNATLVSDELLISEAMRPCSKKPLYKPYLLILEDKAHFQEALQAQKDDFITYLSHVALHVKSRYQKQNMRVLDTIELTFSPTCFKVDFNDGLAKITPMK